VELKRAIFLGRVWSKGVVHGGRQSFHTQEQRKDGRLSGPSFGNTYKLENVLNV
jgi:hypothetical protein